MLEWHDFVEQLLSEESSFDGISLSFDGTAHSVGVPPIIKASVLMLDKMITHQGKFNILVFPERIQSIFIFTLIKLLHNIAEGKIERAYNPEAFKPGEKLKLGNAVVEFVGIEENKNERRMRIKVADLIISAPIEYFPLFQLTNTQRRLSTYKQYVAEKKKVEGLVSYSTADEKFLKLLADYRTHMDSSIVNMTSVINAKELLSTCKLCGRDIKDILLVGHADYEGNVRNIGAGQLGGVPAIVLASDLYAIAALADQGHPIQSIIIDGSNANILLSQMDALDDLMRLGVPITCVTDIVNSFDLQPFLDRQFNVWRWDETSITDHLYDVNPLSSDRKIKHCAKREVEYLVSDGNEISIAIRKLYFHRGEAQTLSAQMLKLFDKLFSLAFVALRETVPFNDGQLIQPKLILDECSSILADEKNYLSSKTYDDYITIIGCLKKVFAKGCPLSKHDALATKLRKEKYKNICIVVPERSDKKHVQEYWQMWCRRQRLITQVYVLYPAEYYPALTTQFSATVVVGWLKRAIMRKILYGFNTQTYTILLYDYEKRWKNYDTQKWNSALDSLQNRKTIERSFATDKLHAITVRCCRKPVANAATGCWIAAQSLARWITNPLDFLLNYWNSEVIVCLLSCLKRWIVSLPTQMNCSTHTIIPPSIKINCTKEIFSFITKAIDTTRVSGTILEWALLAKFRLQMEKTTMLNFWIATSLNGRFQFISLTVDILNNLVSKQFERASILLGKVLFVRCPKKPTIIL